MELESSSFIKDGLAAVPMSSKPLDPSIVILDLPSLKLVSEGPTSNFFFVLASFEAAISTKSALSPSCGEELVKVRLNWL